MATIKKEIDNALLSGAEGGLKFISKIARRISPRLRIEGGYDDEKVNSALQNDREFNEQLAKEGLLPLRDKSGSVVYLVTREEPTINRKSGLTELETRNGIKYKGGFIDIQQIWDDLDSKEERDPEINRVPVETVLKRLQDDGTLPGTLTNLTTRPLIILFGKPDSNGRWNATDVDVIVGAPSSQVEFSQISAT